MCQQDCHPGVCVESTPCPDQARERNSLVVQNGITVSSSPGSTVIPLKNNLPDFRQSVDSKYVKLGYHYFITDFMPVFLVCLLLVVLAEISSLSSAEVVILQLWEQLWEHLQFNLLHVMLYSGATAFLVAMCIMCRPKRIYLVDFACHKSDDDRKCPVDLLEYFAERAGVYTEANVEFQKKVFLRSGLGEETYLPAFAYHEPPILPSMKQARFEAEEVMFDAMDELFLKTGLKPKDIDILIVNCSCFTPTPSLSSMIVNHYKMRSNIRSFNLGGMGCSASMISIDLAKDLLTTHPNSYAVVMSTENITFNWYSGNKKSMLVTNCLFRVGGAAILLTNKRSERRRSKFELIHSVRTHRAPDDKSFLSVIQEEDDDGVVGVSLSKHLMEVAGDALKTNMTTLGPLVLPFSEQLRFLFDLISRNLFHSSKKPYIPDFKLAFDHFLLHAGGRGVLDELQKNLKLSDVLMEPSRMTLHRFGNTSSSCLWYELAYLEAKGRIMKGDRLWQVGFGSGFKCNSAVWRALSTLKTPTQHNPWLECIHSYPAKTRIPTEMTDTIRSKRFFYRTIDGNLFDCQQGLKLAADRRNILSEPDVPEDLNGAGHRSA